MVMAKRAEKKPPKEAVFEAYNALMKQSLQVSLMLVALAAGTSFASGGHEAAVLTALEGYEWSPRHTALMLGTDGEAALIAVADDEAVRSLYRQRALAAIAEYPTETALDYLANRLGERDRMIERRRVTDALCDGFGAIEPERVRLLLEPMLVETDPHLRVRAANCLLRPGFEAARPALDRYQRRVQGTWEAKAAGVTNE